MLDVNAICHSYLCKKCYLIKYSKKEKKNICIQPVTANFLVKLGISPNEFEFQKTQCYNSRKYSIYVFVCFQNILPFCMRKFLQEYNLLQEENILK